MIIHPAESAETDGVNDGDGVGMIQHHDRARFRIEPPIGIPRAPTKSHCRTSVPRTIKRTAGDIRSTDPFSERDWR